MAKTKISALTTLADGSIAIGDLIPIVDIDDFSQAASGTTKKVTITSLASAVATAFSSDAATFTNLTATGTLGVTGVSTLTGSVGIGAAPTVKLQVETSAGNGFKFTESGTPGGYYSSFTVDGTGVKIDSGSGVRDLRLRIGASDKLTIDTTGAVTMAGTLGVTGLLTVDANIKFPATQVASADANTLDDYEESTWTPTLGGSWTTNPTSISGSYVKIGRCVNIFITFVGGAKSTATSGYFEGLPISITISGTGSVVDSSVIANGSALFANTDRVWVTGTSFSNTNYISGFYFSAS